MLDMDFNCKGVTWVGTVYQRFETMCQEVEDIMCQDTAKYVESQVQNVGTSVKKFYAEVMQDLMPPSSLDPVKDNTLGLSLGRSADFGTYEKSKVLFEEDLVKENANAHELLGKTTEEGVAQRMHKSTKAGFKEDPTKEMPPPLMSEVITPAEKYTSKAMLLRKVHRKNNSLLPSSLDPIKGEGPNTSLEQDGVGMYTMPCVLTGSAREKQHSHKASEETASVMKDSFQKRSIYKKSKAVTEGNSAKEKPASFKVNEVTATAGKDSSQASSLIKICSLPPSSWDPFRGMDPQLSLEQNEGRAYANFGSLDSLINSCYINEKLPPMEVSSLITPARKGPSQVASFSELPCEVHEEACNENISIPTSVEPQVCSFHKETGISCSNFMVEHISDNSGTGTSTTCQAASLIDSSWNGFENHSDCADLDTYMALLETEIAGRFDNSEVDESTDHAEQRNETTEELCNANLEDSCIVVDSREVSFVPHRPGKNRSYKKKLHDALAFRLRSVKKREYEQLATWCRGIDRQEKAENSSPSALLDLKSRNLPTNDLHESDWELL